MTQLSEEILTLPNPSTVQVAEQDEFDPVSNGIRGLFEADNAIQAAITALFEERDVEAASDAVNDVIIALQAAQAEYWERGRIRRGGSQSKRNERKDSRK